MEGLESFALVAGAIAVTLPTVAAIVNVSKLIRAKGDHFVVSVAGEKFVIDVNAVDRANVEIIDSATRAVEKRIKISA